MKVFGIVTLTGATMLLITACVVSNVCSVQFEQNCGGHLKHASHASTISLAKQELGTAIEYLESHDLTRGSTHLLYPTPECDLGFWYNNLSASLTELDLAASENDQVASTNQLIKLRETLLHHGKKGTKLTLPPNVSVFPNQLGFSSLVLAGLVGLSIGGLAMCGDQKTNNCSDCSDCQNRHICTSK